MESEAILEVQGLEKRFGQRHVLCGLSFEVPKGSIFGFLGGNGTGKTTTFRIISGLMRADRGVVRVAGHDVTAARGEAQRQLGVLPEAPHFPVWMTPSEYLGHVGELSGLRAKEAESRAADLLERVGLQDHHNQRIRGFSRGMLQRLGLAQALVHRPPLLLLDEPVSALDPMGRVDVFGLLEELRGESTIVLSSHILEDIERVCDRVAFLRDGQIVLEGETEAVKQSFDLKLGFSLDIGATSEALHRFVVDLQEQACLSKVTLVQEWAGGGRLDVQSDEVSDAAVLLPRLVAEAGLALWKLTYLQPNLEQLFVRLQQDKSSVEEVQA